MRWKLCRKPSYRATHIKAGTWGFCVPLLAVTVITKTLSTRACTIGSTVAYSVATVAAVKRA